MPSYAQPIEQLKSEILANSHSAYRIAEKLRQVVQEYDFNLDHPLTISIGIIEYNQKGSIDDMIKAADHALYRAKHEGRNQSVVSQK